MPIFPLDRADYYPGLARFRAVSIGGPGDPDGGVTTDVGDGAVSLFLPPNLSFKDGIEYDNNVQLGIIGGALRDGVTQSNDIGEAISNAVEAGKSLWTNFNLTNPEFARAALARWTPSNLLGVPVGAAVQAGLRTTINPNRRTLFREVRPRDFNFTFKMIANSADEASQIQDIIAYFRTNMYPEPIAGGTAYNYPNMFNIELTYDGQQVGSLIQPCYLVSLDTTYNQSSMGYHADGMPSEVDIALSFYEERPLDRDDIRQGF